MKQLPHGQYNFQETEERILEFWHSRPFFKPEFNPETGEVDEGIFSNNGNGKSSNRSTVTAKESSNRSTVPTEESSKFWALVCPPPNAYDRPHMGNLSGYPYMDVLGRYNRMQGKRVLVFPGKDHAGIEGETTFVKKLEKEGKRKQDFSREEFYQMCYDSQQQFIKHILNDEKRVGLSADFDRNLYTLDPKVVNRVLETFIQMYNDGLVYKGVRIVNWDVKTQSTLSDSQCKRIEQTGKLYYIKYPLKANENANHNTILDYESTKSQQKTDQDQERNGANRPKDIQDGDDYLLVATTRPETMLGDTALVVNPSDERYKKYIGRTVVLPLANREIPIITSGRIEKEFGTGVLKLTPAHANDDYEIMLEWNEGMQSDTEKVSYINIIDRYTKLTGPIPDKYKGLKVNPAREEVVKDLKHEGYLVKEESITQNVLISERSEAIIEPIMASQWYINVEPLRKKLMEVVENEELKIYPSYAAKKYLSWVKNLRDWAISRNLWWGYRMPVWYNGEIKEIVDENGKVQVNIIQNGVEEELDFNNRDQMRVQTESPGEGWVQDNEILDTWFSSGQWPMMCLETEGLMEHFYPTDVLVSGYDLLIKWDLTMVLFSIYKTGQVPFKNLYLTGLVKGTDGQKMSKSKGNFVPIDEVKENYGIDAFRMNCFYQNKAGASYAITNETLKNFRNFNNKIWNASKFVMMKVEGLEEAKFAKVNKIAKTGAAEAESARKEEEADFYKQLKRTRTVTDLKNFLGEWGLLENLENDDEKFLEELERVEKKYVQDLEKYRFGRVSSDLYDSFWHYYCDIYIEQTKPRLDSHNSSSPLACKIVLFYGLMSYLRMLHPFIPFITEEIWQHLCNNGEFNIPVMYS